MKTNKIVLALLFSGISAMKLTQQPPMQLSQSQVAKDAGAKMKETLKGMDDEAVTKLAKDQVKETPKKEKPAPGEAEVKDAEMKAVEAALSRRILDRLAGGYGPYSAYPWAGSPLLDRVAAVHAYHDMVLGYEAANNIYGYLVPALGDVKAVLDIVTNTDGMVAGKAGVPVPADPVTSAGKLGAAVAAITAPQVNSGATTEAAPATTSLVQIEEAKAPAGPAPSAAPPNDHSEAPKHVEEPNQIYQWVGAAAPKMPLVPVLVDPKLLVNTMGDVDLRLRDMIIEGVNGYDLVQLDESKGQPEPPAADEDLSGLAQPDFLKKMFGQTSPEPPKMNQLLQLNEPEDPDFNQLKQWFGKTSPMPTSLNQQGEIGTNRANTDEFIQIQGVPVLVQPELMLATNQFAQAGLGLPLEIGPDDVQVLQQKQDFSPIFDDAVTLQVNGVPVYVKPEAMMDENSMGGVSMGMNIIMGPDDLKFAQKTKPRKNNFLQTKNPVNNPPYNNWSVNQPSVPHDAGGRGDQDLGQRDILIDGVNGYDFVQLQNPVNNPPYNNWSVNQPSVPHDSGDQGTQDLGQRDYIIDGVNGYDFAQLKQEN